MDLDLFLHMLYLKGEIDEQQSINRHLIGKVDSYVDKIRKLEHKNKILSDKMEVLAKKTSKLDLKNKSLSMNDKASTEKVAKLEERNSELMKSNKKLYTKFKKEKMKARALENNNPNKEEEEHESFASRDSSSSRSKENVGPNDDDENQMALAGSQPALENNYNNNQEEMDSNSSDHAPEKLSKGCQCGPCGTFWISSADLELLRQTHSAEQMQALSSFLHPIEDLKAAIHTEVPTPVNDVPPSSPKKNLTAFDVNDVD
ncbi:uncharacterized protein LOC108669396 [Hyalella azteca]|uniref:Uncharacterized protein LOC108669396 n=1 Tax=Hyalella azteca TaxID=294128 RepID=A0A8B7NFJ0_HYAAZ|nr:uncharacterized protein LOC108669396 [Hyalella azteca]